MAIIVMKVSIMNLLSSIIITIALDRFISGVMGDLLASWPLLKSSSLLIGHDFSYDWPGTNILTPTTLMIF